MNLPRPARTSISLLSGLLLALAFPNFNHPIFAWVAVALLIAAAIGSRPLEAALYGFLHAEVFYTVSLSWIYTVIRQYGDVDRYTPAVLLGLIVLAESVFTMVFTLLIAWWSKRGAGRACFFAPFLWVALDYAKTHLPHIAFPWNSIGYAIAEKLSLLQLAAWTGIYGLSFVVVAFNALLAWLAVRRTRRAWVVAIGATIVLVGTILIGPHFVPRATPREIAHLVQTNFEQAMVHPPDWLVTHAGDLDQLEELSVSAAKNAPGLVVWPEVPAPFSLQDPDFAPRAERIARNGGQDFLVGVDDWKQGPKGHLQASNSAVLLDPFGRRAFTYDKIHLVPFSEYVPLRRWIPFAHQLIAEIGDFTPGTQYGVGILPGGRFGVFICYEAIFPNEVRQFVENGADVLINISNDGWFGRGAAPAQHLLMARVRAVENRRWLLRDTNNGFTVVIDPYGRTVASLPTDIRGELDARYDFRRDRTLYTRWGDWWAWLCVLAVFIELGESVLRRGREGPASKSKVER
jgi:apolipoprotein N-acyltransferase